MTLQVLLCSIPFMITTSVGIIILIAVNKEVTLTRITVATTAIILALDLAVIPFYGVYGAATVMVTTTALRWGIIYWLLSRSVWSPVHGLIRTLGIPLFGILFMVAAAVLVYPLGYYFSLLAGLAAYGIVAAAGCLWNPDEQACI